VNVEGLVGAGALARREVVSSHAGVLEVGAGHRVVLAHAGVLEVGAGDPGGRGAGVVKHPLQVVEVGDAKGEGAGGDGWRGVSTQ
jgi:hypothetical protein